jgi:nitrite reductase/ring-hydroxylating ferredoxin subunit
LKWQLGCSAPIKEDAMTTLSPDRSPSATASRRAVLVSAGGATLALCLAGCSGGGTAAPTAAGTAGAGSAGTTVAAADVPVGSGRIVGEFVVTQPTEGTFEAFNYLCTHQNLPVQHVSDSAIVCGRHGSTFSLADGSVLTGPATAALAKATVTRSGDTLTIA